MLDLIYVALTLALFALVGLVAKGVEKLGPRAGGSGRSFETVPETTPGEERA